MSVYKRIANWNEEVIQLVNDLAENPPEGCDPLEPLEEAEENHLFMKQDIINVHDKLKEICPDNIFTTLEIPQLITEDLFTEIEDAITNGWCAECAEEPGVTTINLGTFVSDAWSHTPHENQCCGKVYTTGFPWPYDDLTETTYNTDYHDETQYYDYNDAQLVIIKATYKQANTAGVNWAENDQLRLYYEALITPLEAAIQKLEGELDILRAQLAVCVANCQEIIDSITAKEAELQILETQLEEYKAKHAECVAKAVIYSQECDAAATANWTAYGALKSWNPGIINLASQLQGMYAPWGTKYYGYGYTWSTFRIRGSFNGGEEVTMGYGKFTPSGKPFTQNIAQTRTGHECRIQYTIRTRCGLWAANLGTCIFGTWSDPELYDELTPIHIWRAGDTQSIVAYIGHGTPP